eukprot:COSAG06_NODE_12692_length_1342_cov_1.122285_2_plen_76_part_01
MAPNNVGNSLSAGLRHVAACDIFRLLAMAAIDPRQLDGFQGVDGVFLKVNQYFFNDTATTEIYTRTYTLSLHDALP